MAMAASVAHAARAEQPQNPVTGKSLTDPQRHGRMLVPGTGELRRFEVLGVCVPVMTGFWIRVTRFTSQLQWVGVSSAAEP